MALDEKKIKKKIQAVLDTISPGEFVCEERKNRGKSAINKPVDLQISLRSQPDNALICIEVADVNSTQLVNEATRLFFDCCYRKILILGTNNVPQTTGKNICEDVLKRFYGQDDIKFTPARVILYNENFEKDFEEEVEKILREFLVRY